MMRQATDTKKSLYNMIPDCKKTKRNKQKKPKPTKQKTPKQKNTKNNKTKTKPNTSQRIFTVSLLSFILVCLSFHFV